MSEARAVQKHPSEKDRLKAAELLGKRFGMFTEKQDVTVDAQLEITVDYGDDTS